jgi:hypothetical protein
MSSIPYRCYQIIAFIALWVAGAFAFRAYTIIPDAIEMTLNRDFMDKIDSDTLCLFENYKWVFPIILIIWVSSLISVWLRYRSSYLIVILSFFVLFIGANQIASIAMKPIKQYEELKKKQQKKLLNDLMKPKPMKPNQAANKAQ